VNERKPLLHGNDAQALLSALAAETSTGVADVLSRLRGPWALVYWQEAERRLWYGRDVVGLRTSTRPTFNLYPSSALREYVKAFTLYVVSCSNQFECLFSMTLRRGRQAQPPHAPP
jgi:hypothetical protein